MQVEDSYEGAVRRLSRLSHGGADLLPSRRDDQEAALQTRLRDLEELATIATEENERLERELADARETILRLQEQLTAADRLRLRELMEGAPESERPRRSILPWLAALAATGAVAAATVTLRPWQYAPQARTLAQTELRRHVLHPWAMPLELAPPSPVVAPPKPVAAVVVAVPPPVVAAAVVPEEKHAAKRRTPHHHHAAAPKPAKTHAAAARPAGKEADDPLLGL